MVDKVLALLSIVVFIGFLLIVVVFIKRPDLTIITVGVILMAVYDFWTAFRNSGGGSGPHN